MRLFAGLEAERSVATSCLRIPGAGAGAVREVVEVAEAAVEEALSRHPSKSEALLAAMGAVKAHLELPFEGVVATQARVCSKCTQRSNGTERSEIPF